MSGTKATPTLIEPVINEQNIESGSGVHDAPEGEGYGTSSFGERLVYKEKGCCVGWRDRGFAICYYVHIFIMIILAIVLPAEYFGAAPYEDEESIISNYTPAPTFEWQNGLYPPSPTFNWETTFTPYDEEEIDLPPVGGVIVTILIQCIVGVLFGLLWLKLIEKFASSIIKVSLFLVLSSLGLITLILFINAGSAGIVGLIFFAAYGLYIYCVWNRIPFTSALLKISSSITQSFEGTIWLSFGIIPFNIGWTIIICCAGVGLVFMLASSGASGLVYFLLFLLLVVSYTWGIQVNKNVLHTSICAVTGTWYFSKQVHKPTLPALKRSVTTSFGSICLGSLIVAILNAIEALIRPCRKGPLACCICCILKCIKKLVRYFNQYAFAQVAIYGCNFIQAAKQTWGLFMSRGLIAIVKDSLASQVLIMGSLLDFVICFFVGWFLIPTVFYSKSWNDSNYKEDVLSYRIIASLIGADLAFIICQTMLRVVQSTIIALFVCFAEDPSALKENRPLQYDMLVSSKLELQRMGETGHTGIDEGNEQNAYQNVEPIPQANYAHMNIQSVNTQQPN